jgi:virginiamycin B lyase
MREIRLPAGWTPYAVTLDVAGDVWTTLLAPAGLGRLRAAAAPRDDVAVPDRPEPGEAARLEEIPDGGQPMLLAFDADETLWYTRTDDRLGRRDAAGRHELIDLPEGSAPYGLGVAPGGAIWFTAPGIDRIGRRDPDGRITLIDIPVPDARAAMLTITSDGTAWATLNGAGSLIRISNDKADIIELPPGHAPAAPVGIAAASGSAASGTAVWYADIAGGCLGRVSQDGAIDQVVFDDAGCRPHAVAADPAGGCWATLWGSGQLARVTDDGAVTRHDLPGKEPHGLGVSEAAVWVAMESGSLVRVDRIRNGR